MSSPFSAAGAPPAVERRGRIELIDALRAFALAGILQVNIQLFLWGAGDPLGYFLTAPRPIDRAVHWLVGTLVVVKFISIFAFLFGVGAALQWRKLVQRFGDAAARAHYRRRLVFLLLIGAAHGTLLFFGDVLGFYALCGFVLLRYLDAPSAQLVRALRLWWIAFGVLTVLLWLTDEVGRMAAPPVGDPSQIPLGTLQRFALYGTGDYARQLAVRVDDFLAVQTSMLIGALPQIVGLFLLGLLAGRQGWLTHPERHRTVWRTATWIGVAAIPIAAVGAWLNQQAVLTAPGDPSLTGYVLQIAGSPLACLYVAGFVRLRHTAFMHAVVRWLAPAGRMPLTNYLMQSLLMGAVLSGWGLGFGPTLRHADLAGLALLIVVLQWIGSRAWIARFRQGPVEALWSYVTYRG